MHIGNIPLYLRILPFVSERERERERQKAKAHTQIPPRSAQGMNRSAAEKLLPLRLCGEREGGGKMAKDERERERL